MLKASIPQSINLMVTMDQTVTIRASVHDVERSLLISVALVVLVVFVFLRSSARRSSRQWPCPYR